MSQTDLIASKDHMETLEEAALGYLTRHQAQHLRDQDLFDRAVVHLTSTLRANQTIAENVVARAYGKLRNSDDQRFLDVSNSTAEIAMLVDPRTGMNYAVPTALIFRHFIDARQPNKPH
jgi:hypothetical protein